MTRPGSSDDSDLDEQAGNEIRAHLVRTGFTPVNFCS